MYATCDVGVGGNGNVVVVVDYGNMSNRSAPLSTAAAYTATTNIGGQVYIYHHYYHHTTAGMMDDGCGYK